MSHTIRSLSSGAAFEGAAVGINTPEFHRALEEWSKTASTDRRLGAHDQGVRHWGIIAARHGGVIKPELDHREDGDGRTYTVGAFPLQALPSGLRAAITPAAEGHVVIEADWRASHWQHLAFASGDEAMKADLETGDLYLAACPAFDRKPAKIGLNALLNGGGRPALIKAFDGDEAKADAFKEHASGLLRQRWPVAGRTLDELRADAVRQGFAEDEHSAAGIALMRLEAEALRAAVEATRAAFPQARLMVPMHDGVLLSAPEDVASDVASRIALEMARASTRASSVARPDLWVSVKVSKSWGGDVPTLLGSKARGEALKSLDDCDDLGGLLLAAGAMLDMLKTAKARFHNSTSQWKLVNQAIKAAEDALRWSASKERKAGAAEPVKLTHYQPTYTNLCKVIAEDPALPRVSYDLRANAPLIGGERVNDTLLRSTYLPPLEQRYGMLTVSEQTLGGALLDTAMAHSFDPVLDYFNGLPAWDKVPRASYWLQDFAGVVGPDALIRAYSFKWLMSIVARAFKPGCKVDTLLVLLGAQGAKKSTMLKAIAPAGSFSDIAIDPHDKDSVLRASRYAVVEWGEMTGLSKRDVSALKAYFARPDDEVRPPYAHADVKILRRVVFAATTNVADFLTDETGARRYWPVQVADDINVAGLEAAKDQIWAEVVEMYKALDFELSNDEREALRESDPEGYETWAYRWWLSPSEVALKEAADVDFTADDPHEPQILRYAADHGGVVRLEEMMTHLGIHVGDFSRSKGPLVTCLKRLKFESKRVRLEDQTQVRAWVAPAGLDLTPYAGRSAYARNLASLAQAFRPN